MEDESGRSPPKTEENKAFRGRSVTKLPKGPLHRLHYRELGGIHRMHRQPVQSQIYHKLPGRLAFSLRTLVDESVLHEGHVFLGFTKDGQFVISYTLHVEADEHTAYPTYVYRLQWWRFIPYKKLKKIHEVRLFGEEEIQQDIHLAMCEWPTDSSRIMVHGYCARSENEEKHQCFVTITAVPPILPCDDCNQVAILQAQSGTAAHSPFVTMCETPPRCMNHGFTVHTKYELAPPYPAFTPKVFLKLDGVVILNTGDSFVAVSVDIEDNHGGFGFGLYSPRVNRSLSNLSTASSPSEAEDGMSTDSQDRLSELRGLDDADPSSDSGMNLLAGSPCVPPGLRSPAQSPSYPAFRSPQSPCSSGFRSPGSVAPPKDSVKDTTNVKDTTDRAPLRERRNSSSGKENVLNKNLGSPGLVVPGGSGIGGDSTPSRQPRPIDVYNFEASTPNPRTPREKDMDSYTDSSSPEHCDTEPPRVRASLAFYQGARLAASADEGPFSGVESQPLDGPDQEFEKPEEPERSPGTFRPAGMLRVNPAQRSLSLAPPESFGITRGPLAMSPGYKFDHQSGGSTCSSCFSSPIILQSESQCFTYSVRRYIETYGQVRPDSPIDMEDDLNLAYHSLLPLEVHGANYCPMKLLTKQCLTPQMPCVVVKQLTLDIEHYLGEAIRTCAEWGHRYLAFTDYDAQIVEVCPESAEVIAIVYVLIRARPPKPKNTQHVHGLRSVPKLYQTGLKLVWNLRTGSYNTIAVDDLVEVNQAELIRKRWHPGNRIVEMVQRKVYTPTPFSTSVNVLTNQPVIRGQSLNMLLDRHHYVAILL